jgi:hypothetical protein
MKQFASILASAIILIFTSCAGGGSEEKKADTAAAAVDTTAKTVFQPFNLIMIRHKVKDFDKWKVNYLAHDSVRTAYGIRKDILARDVADSNMVTVFDQFTDLAKAKQFAALPNLKEAMQKGGVTGMPSFDYIRVVRLADMNFTAKDRVLVKHKVKDYDAWLKAYDAEGKATRASFGMVDLGIARGLDDSTVVYIYFGITDMAKAKARGDSPELKKIMEDAGVIGKPEMFSFKEVQ